jgi:hypothetical protein
VALAAFVAEEPLSSVLNMRYVFRSSGLQLENFSASIMYLYKFNTSHLHYVLPISG